MRLVSDGNAGWGFVLSEELGGRLDAVARVPAGSAVAFRRAVVDAVVADGYSPDAVSAKRRRPFNLTQIRGVRLALHVLVLRPLRSPERRHEIASGLRAMGDEEALYWFARVRAGADGSRALRALRLLLADDHRP